MITRVRFAKELLTKVTTLERLAADVADGTAHSQRTIPKRDGTTRTITRPGLLLSILLKKTNELLTTNSPAISDHAYGFVRKRSAHLNANQHLGRALVIRIDLRDFFGSISADQVENSLAEFDFDPQAASLGTRLMTVDGRLPTGFHTSPLLSNVIFRATDDVLSSLAQSTGHTYTRFVDDIVFSGEADPALPKRIADAIESQGWEINPSKTAIMRRGGKQYVTGLSVSDATKARIPPQLKRRMRLKLHLIERFGYERYMSEFKGEALGDHPRKLYGMARYIAAVEKDVGRTMFDTLDRHVDDSWYEQSDDELLRWLDEFQD